MEAKAKEAELEKQILENAKIKAQMEAEYEKLKSDNDKMKAQQEKMIQE